MNQISKHYSFYLHRRNTSLAIAQLNRLIDRHVKMQSSSVCASKCNPCFNWDVRKYTTSSFKMRYAILVLNRPLTQNLSFIKNMWNTAAVRVTVDGGTNRWDTYISTFSEDVQKSLKNPDLITGDFDSIRNDIMEKYKKKGCKVINTPDQNYTDFTKALMELDKHCRQNKLEVDTFIALSQSSGRLDQVLGNIQTLFLVKDKGIISPNINVFMITDDAISWLLNPGHHIIDVPQEISSLKKSWCSLVPIGETCNSVTTVGLKWNLDNCELKFGHIVSTSNTFEGLGKVIINCSNTLLWTMKFLNLSDPPKLGNGAPNITT